MTLAIPHGWWLAPMAVTVLAFGIAVVKQDREPCDHYGLLGRAVVNLMLYGAAAIVSLVAWLVWAVVG